MESSGSSGSRKVALILYDTPRPCAGSDAFRYFQRTSHCGSTLLGAEGTAELLAFGVQVGCDGWWLQHRGEPTEHFDLFDSKIELAKRKGATEVTPREWV